MDQSGASPVDPRVPSESAQYVQCVSLYEMPGAVVVLVDVDTDNVESGAPVTLPSAASTAPANL